MTPSVLLTVSPPGLYRLARGPGVLRARAERSAWRWCQADGVGIADRTGLFAALASALSLPDYFGANWDALLDCLRDFDDDSAPGVVIHLTGFAAFAAAQPGDWATLREILAQAADELNASGTALYVLIAGPAGRGLTALLP